MPALQQVFCSHCRRNHRLAEMTIFRDMCNHCFERDYTLCTICARLVINCRLQMVDGDPCCEDCYLNRDSLSSWLPKPFDVSVATYQRIGSKRKYGVEIETHSCSDHRQLRGCTNFGSKCDPTISGREFDSPILYGDEGFDHIVDFLAFAEEREWEVDSRCGCHTHYDMRPEPDESLYRIAYAYKMTYPLWRRCVPRSRVGGAYCHSPNYTLAGIERAVDRGTGFSQFANSVDRYTYMNLCAYGYHVTFENRLLEGTLDAGDICNWIAVNCRFMDRVKKLSFSDQRDMFYPPGRSSQARSPARAQFRACVDLIDDANLTDWVAHRARHVGMIPVRGPGLSNRT